MNQISKLLTGLLLVAMVGFMGSCKKSFDNPPGASDPAIVPNKTIAQLKALHASYGAFDIVNDDIIISGIVVADDRSGNLYKQLYIQDETGGIEVKLDQPGLYGTYPVGRKIFIKCKGLCISDYNRMIQLGVKAYPSGAPSLEAIPVSMIGNYVIGGSLNNPVTPKVVALTDLGGGSIDMQNPLLGTLIQLEDLEFVNTNNTYSDTSAYKKDQNDTLKNCSTGRIIMRTSGYARFAGARVKQGNGSIAAIYTVFQSSPTFSGTKQLLLRDTTDIKFNNPRCGAPPVGSVIYIDENFETQSANTTAPYTPVTIAGWQNAAEVGTRTYDARIFSGSKYAYLSGFGAGGPVTTWLVTKVINRTTATTTLKFETKQDFLLSSYPGGTNVAAGLKVLTSTNYTGAGNPWAAGVTWTDITSQATLSPGSTTSAFPSAYTASGNISLNGSGNIYVAFRYEGDDPAGTASDKTSAWEIDNIQVLGL
ncbi:MAG: DUF5689 domain-containing protein [Bacteroidota bacterium]